MQEEVALDLTRRQRAMRTALTAGFPVDRVILRRRYARWWSMCPSKSVSTFRGAHTPPARVAPTQDNAIDRETGGKRRSHSALPPRQVQRHLLLHTSAFALRLFALSPGPQSAECHAGWLQPL